MTVLNRIFGVISVVSILSVSFSANLALSDECEPGKDKVRTSKGHKQLCVDGEWKDAAGLKGKKGGEMAVKGEHGNTDKQTGEKDCKDCAEIYNKNDGKREGVNVGIDKGETGGKKAGGAAGKETQ